MKKYKQCSLVLLLVSMLSACSEPQPSPLTYTIDGYQYGSIYMNNMNETINDAEVDRVSQAVKAVGGNLLIIGQEYKVTLPVGAVFYSQSPRIQWNAYQILNQVASFLRLYNKDDVQVSVFQVAQASDTLRIQALAQMRARNVENYLWSQDSNARLMYVNKNIAPFQDAGERIEITFRSVLK